MSIKDTLHGEDILAKCLLTLHQLQYTADSLTDTQYLADSTTLFGGAKLLQFSMKA